MANLRQGSGDARGFLHGRVSEREHSNAGVSRARNAGDLTGLKFHSIYKLNLVAGKSAKSEAVKFNSFLRTITNL